MDQLGRADLSRPKVFALRPFHECIKGRKFALPRLRDFALPAVAITKPLITDFGDSSIPLPGT